MSGGGSHAACGRPGNDGGIRWFVSGPGRLGMAGAGRPVAGGGGGARDPAAATGWIGIPRRGPPGDGGDNLYGRGSRHRIRHIYFSQLDMCSLCTLDLALCAKSVNWINLEMCSRQYTELEEVRWRMEDTVYTGRSHFNVTWKYTPLTIMW